MFLHLPREPPASSPFSSLSSQLTASPTPTPTSPSSPIASSSGSSSSGVLAHHSNYFYGFLIAFVILLLLFISCGVGTRKWCMYGQGIVVPDITSSDSERTASSTTKPTFWEALLAEGSPKWSAMAPLSASVVRNKGTSAVESKDPECGFPQKSAIHTTHALRQSFFNMFTRTTPPPKAVDPPPYTKEEPPETLQLAVVISMPSIPRTPTSSKPKEYEIGVTRIPWRESHVES